jgi:cell division protein FtsI/penicillin-binding protein 2
MSTRAFQIRCFLMSALFVGMLSVLSVRLFWIQVWNPWSSNSRGGPGAPHTEVLPGLRGNIVDRNEEVLAKSMPVSSISVDIDHLQNPEVMAVTVAYERVCTLPEWNALSPADKRKRVMGERAIVLDTMKKDTIVEMAIAHAVNVMARPLGMRREELAEKIKKGLYNKESGKYDKKHGEFELIQDLPEDVASGLREVVDQQWIEGFRFEESFKRWYTAKEMAAHVLGYTGEKKGEDVAGKTHYTLTGKCGIESAMNEYLAGKDGWSICKRDLHGMKIPSDDDSLCPPRSGLNVQLTLDMAVQAIAEEELDAGLKEFVAPRGCAIVMDPKTGEILGMVSRPAPDLNNLTNISETATNFATQAMFEPGSTIKIVATSGALNENLVTPQTAIFCHNGHYNEGAVDLKDEHPQGMLTFEGVLEKSNNIGTYMIARQLGMARFYNYLSAYGYGQKTGVLLSGESSGRVRNKGNAVDFSRAAFGYSLSVTPLQVASAFSVIASDGQRRKPHIVKSIIANDGTVVEDFAPEVVCRVIKPDTAKEMRYALTKVTGDGGTAKLARVPGYPVAGKTGTARRMLPNGKYELNHFTVTFAGMMPAENPAFVCVVVLDDPRPPHMDKIYAGNIAGPVFSRIGTRLAAHMNLTPTEPVNTKLAGNKAP